MEYLPSYRDSIQNGTVVSYQNELYHHGIKGMHWGVRRYQNPDGTLTRAGQKRLAKQTYKDDKRKAKRDLQEWGDQANRRYDRDKKYRDSGQLGPDAEKAVRKYKDAKTSAKYRYKQALRDIKYGPMKTNKSDTAVTKRVKEDYRSMNDHEFYNKYYASKNTYARRVHKAKDGDPYRTRINSRSYKVLRKLTKR